MLDEVLRQEHRIPTASEDGLQRIGAGNNRIVFRVVDDRYAAASNGDIVKRAYPYVDENERERAIWNAVEGGDFEEYFVPVIGSSPDAVWIVMPYAEETSNIPSERVQVVQERFGGSDVSKNDFGVYGGAVRCYDYGSCLSPESAQRGFSTRSDT